jgi:hypothetical protein
MLRFIYLFCVRDSKPRNWNKLFPHRFILNITIFLCCCSDQKNKVLNRFASKKYWFIIIPFFYTIIIICIIFVVLLTLYLPNFEISKITKVPYGLERRRSRAMRPPKHALSSHTTSLHTACLTWKAAAPMCQRTPFSCQLKSACRRPARHKESLERDWTRESQPKPPLTRTTLN